VRFSVYLCKIEIVHEARQQTVKSDRKTTEN